MLVILNSASLIMLHQNFYPFHVISLEKLFNSLESKRMTHHMKWIVAILFYVGIKHDFG